MSMSLYKQGCTVSVGFSHKIININFNINNHNLTIEQHNFIDKYIETKDFLFYRDVFDLVSFSSILISNIVYYLNTNRTLNYIKIVYFFSIS